MKHVMRAMLFALILALASGCAVQAPLTQNATDEPLFVQYDIQYEDNTTLGVDLLVLAPEFEDRRGLEEDVFNTVRGVALDLGRSDILAQQSIFRDRLNERFRAESPFGATARIVVVDVMTGTWVAQR